MKKNELEDFIHSMMNKLTIAYGHVDELYERMCDEDEVFVKESVKEKLSLANFGMTELVKIMEDFRKKVENEVE